MKVTIMAHFNGHRTDFEVKPSSQEGVLCLTVKMTGAYEAIHLFLDADQAELLGQALLGKTTVVRPEGEAA